MIVNTEILYFRDGVTTWRCDVAGFNQIQWTTKAVKVNFSLCGFKLLFLCGPQWLIFDIKYLAEQ